MFTGIVEELAKIKSIIPKSKGTRYAISAEIVVNDLKIDNQLVDRVYKFASIKHIAKNTNGDDEKTISLLNEIIRDLKNYELELRIEELESKFSQDLSENTFNQIRELKKQQNIN